MTHRYASPALALLLSLIAIACTNELGNLESKRTDFVTAPVHRQPFDQALAEACGEGGITDVGQTNFLRQPYLQKMTSTSVDILWTTAAAEAQEVVVRTPDGAEVARVAAGIDEQSDRAEFDQYLARVGGLAASQIYCYEILGEETTWLAQSGFRTAPETGSDTRLEIVVMGDLGTRSGDQYAVLSQLEQVPHDLALITGDLAYEKGTLSDHENNFFAVYPEIMRSIPFFVISGNHDYAADGSVFREVFALFENGGDAGRERWYSFDWGPAHIVALDTEKVDAAQADWLERDLADNQQPWTIVFLHRPPFSSGSHGSTASVQQWFVPLFESYGVDLVLAGHDHNYERTQSIGGVTYIVTGSGGRGTRSVGQSSFTEYAESVAHFTYLEIENGELRAIAIDATGQEFDAVTLR